MKSLDMIMSSRILKLLPELPQELRFKWILNMHEHKILRSSEGREVEDRRSAGVFIVPKTDYSD